MENKKKKNIIIVALCCALVFIGVGYAALSQTLTVTGTGNATGDWNIKITNIQIAQDNNGNPIKTPTATSKSAVPNNTDAVSATFQVEFLQPGDYIEYDVTIQNKGTIDAVLENLTFAPTTNGFITFSIDPTVDALIGTPLTVASPTNTKVVRVRAQFNNVLNMPTNDSDKTLTTTLTFTYIQGTAGSVDIGDIGGGDNTGSSTPVQLYNVSFKSSEDIAAGLASLSNASQGKQMPMIGEGEYYGVGAQYNSSTSWIVTISYMVSGKTYYMRQDGSSFYDWFVVPEGEEVDWNNLGSYTKETPVLNNVQIATSLSDVPTDLQAYADYFTYNMTDLQLYANVTAVN